MTRPRPPGWRPWKRESLNSGTATAEPQFLNLLGPTVRLLLVCEAQRGPATGQGRDSWFWWQNRTRVSQALAPWLFDKDWVSLGVARPPRSVQPPFRPGTRLEAEWPVLRGGPEGHSASQKDVHTGWSGVGSRTVFGLTTCGPAARSLCRLVGALAPHGALAAHLAASHSPAGAVCAWVLPVPSASQGLSGALRSPRPGPRGLHARRDGAGPRGCGGACYQPRVFTQPHCVPPAPAALASSPARGCGVHRQRRGAGKS